MQWSELTIIDQYPFKIETFTIDTTITLIAKRTLQHLKMIKIQVWED